MREMRRGAIVAAAPALAGRPGKPEGRFEANDAESRAMFKKILVPIDVHDREVASEAIETAEALARAFDGELRLIHVASPIAPVAPMAAIPQQVFDEIGIAEQAELSALAAKLTAPPERVSSCVRVGSIYPELLSEAEDWGADHIVVGAHRRTMATFLLGSTAAALSRHAKCSVTVVRSRIRAHLL